MPVAKYYSEEDFLILGRMSKTKNEYYRGEIFAMPGASFQHNQIASALIGDIVQHLKGKECNIFGSDLRVHAWLQSLIICGEPSFVDREFDTIINPSILFEILSPSTEENDRSIKFEFYKNIPTLNQYVLIDSQKILIRVFTRQEDHSWLSEAYTKPEVEWTISSINYKSRVKLLYNGVVFKNS